MRSGAIAAALVGGLLVAHSLGATRGSAARARVEAAGRAGQPVVAHVVVALCDNEHQGIVRVPAHLGNGQDPKGNLYWGARYGLKTFLSRDAGWRRLPHDGSPPPGVLERIVLTRRIGRTAVYLVADAWDGRQIRGAVDRFLRMAGGHRGEAVTARDGGRPVALAAGGQAHLVVYVGHNGLMDFALPAQPPPLPGAQPRSAIVLACRSKQYFEAPLGRAGAHRLLLTTGFMAPEAYTLSAAIQSWLSEGTAPRSREAAARAYHRYQKCGLSGARRLFWSEP